MLPESVAIDEYLEERYPEPALLPADPGERAAVRVLVERFDDLGKPYYALRRGEDGAEARVADGLAGLDAFLATMPFLSGRTFGLADVAYLPWLFRLRDLMDFSLAGHEAIERWLETCSERPSIAAELETVASLA